LPKDVDHISIPSTIQDVIMARVDSLPEAAKDVLQAGSAIEREFSYELIKAVTELPEQELLSHLSVLKDAELLYERGIFPQSTFVFRHALTREVVYDSILAKRRKMLHEKIGNSIEEVYAESLADHYAGLVDHFLASDMHQKAAEYARLASKKSEKTVSLNDAILYAEQGIACLERLPASDEIEKNIIDARTMFGLYLNQMGNFCKSKEAIDPIMESAAHRGYTRRLAQIYIITGAFHLWVEENFPLALEHLGRALRLGEQLGDLISLVLASFCSAYAAAYDCRFQEALSHLEKALNINLAANSLWGVSVIKGSQGGIQWLHGQVGLSFGASSEAVRLAEQSGDIFSNAWAHTHHGSSCFGRGALEEAIGSLSKGGQLGERINQVPITSQARYWLGEAHVEIGEYDLARNRYQEGIEFIDSARLLPSMSKTARMALEKTKVLSGDKNVELELLYSYVRENRLKVCEGLTRKYLGEILLTIGDQHFPEAQHWIEEALQADKRNQMMFYLGRDYAVYAEVFKRKGDIAAAKEQLGRAIDIFKECGADGWVTKAEEALEQLQ
jgi:tetratricopeptide (TPR) repeat protein